MIVALAIGALALVGARLQDTKKDRLLGARWARWVAMTSYWPRWGRLFSAGWSLWLAAIALWLAVTWVHIPLGGAPAGAWRWLG